MKKPVEPRQQVSSGNTWKSPGFSALDNIPEIMIHGKEVL